MHELSLVRNIFASLEHEFTAEEISRLQQVDLKIGKLANVEPILLQNAFKAFLEENPQYQSVVLETQLIPIRIHCEACRAETEVKQYVFHCSACGQASRNIISGEELLIHQVHFQDANPVADPVPE